MSAYGYCPRCGGLGMSRERRQNGNDRCENGHGYPSVSAVANPLLPVSADITALVAEEERLREEGGREERKATVAWLRDAADTPDNHARSLLLRIVDGLERGEHRREEER
ncbi:MAG: hypothetical protein RLZZ299_782 [Pseudomonadota bacterium]